MPGIVDVHLHFNEPGRTHWEGAATGSRALAAGGGTTFFDMPLNSTPCTITPRDFDAKRAALEAASITDFGLWGGLIPGAVGEMPAMAERGVVGFKAFMCDSGLAEFPRADDLTLMEGMRQAASLGLPIAVHAESQELTTRWPPRPECPRSPASRIPPPSTPISSGKWRRATRAKCRPTRFGTSPMASNSFHRSTPPRIRHC